MFIPQDDVFCLFTYPIQRVYHIGMIRDHHHLSPCIVFPMGIEAYDFLQRVEVRSRRSRGRAVYREAFFEGRMLSIVRCGIGPERAAHALRGLRTQPSFVLCAGCAGALVPELKIGDFVISSETIAENSVARACDPALVRLAKHACDHVGAGSHLGRTLTTDRAVFPRADREALHHLTAAVSVDMETHALRQVAEEFGAPFVSVRVISDDIRSETPPPRHMSVNDILRNPRALHKTIPAVWRRRVFMARLKSAVAGLHPVLVRMIRAAGKDAVLSGRRSVIG
jgi:adenosylhomocysteine nucleosidase